MKGDNDSMRRSRRLRIAAALVFAAALAGGVMFVRVTQRERGAEHTRHESVATDEAPAGGQDSTFARYALGDVFTYSLSHEAVVDMAEGGRFYHLAAGGEWVVRVIEIQSDHVQLAASLQKAVLTSTQARPGQEQDYSTAAAQLAQPMFFTLDASGKVEDVRFDPSTSRSVIDLLRSVVALSQVSAPDRPTPSWQTTENDATGKYLAEYRKLPGTRGVSKQKQRYLEVLASNAAVGAELVVDVVSSEGEVTLDERSVLKTLSVRDVVRTRTQMLPEMTSTTKLTLTRIAATHDLASARTLRDRAAKLAPLALYESPPTHSDTAAIDRAKVAGRKLGDFVRDFAALPSLEDSSFEQRDKSRRLFIELAALFRLDDAAVDQAMALIQSGSKVSSALWDAFASAGTPKAQAALRELIENPRFGLEDRRTQMIGLSFVTTPVPETLDFLFEHVDDAEQGQQARFGIGTALNHLRGKDDARVAADLQRLAHQLAGANTARDMSDYLRAIGNAGVGQGKALLTPYLEHDSPDVRAAAASALRFMPGEDVVTTLRGVIEKDDDGMVRASAIQAAGERAPDRALLEAVYQASIGDSSKLVRDQAEDTLSRWAANYPPIGESLAAFKQEAAQAVPSPSQQAPL